MSASPPTPASSLPILEYIGDQAIFQQTIADFIVAVVRQGFSLRAAAGAASIPYRVVAQWVDVVLTFRNQVEIAMAQRVYALEARLLNTEDPVQGKVLMQALRRAAPEVWADPKEAPPDVTTLPQMITLTVVQPDPRPLPKFIEESAIAPNAPSTRSVQ